MQHEGRQALQGKGFSGSMGGGSSIGGSSCSLLGTSAGSTIMVRPRTVPQRLPNCMPLC